MTAAEFKEIRHKLGLSLTEMGRAIGYKGNPNTLKTQIHEYENGKRDIPPWIARLVAMYGKHGVS